MGIRHIVVFTFNEGVADDTVADIERRLNELTGVIPQIKAYSCGTDLGLADGNYDFAVVADFDNETDYIVYRDDPTHRRVITDLIAPNISSRCAVQLAI